MGWAYLDHPVLEGALVVHLVRHPVKVVNSLLRSGWADWSEHWQRKRMSDLPNDAVGFSIQKWYRVNNLLSKSLRVDLRVRAEERMGILKRLNLKQIDDFDDNKENHHPLSQLADKSPSVRNRIKAGPARITWDDLPSEVQELAEEYGYERL